MAPHRLGARALVCLALVGTHAGAVPATVLGPELPTGQPHEVVDTVVASAPETSPGMTTQARDLQRITERAGPLRAVSAVPGRSDRIIGVPQSQMERPDTSAGVAGDVSVTASQTWMSDTAFALLAVLAVLGVLVVGLRSVAAKRGGGLNGRAPSPAGVLEILGRYPVGRGVSLILLRLDRRVLLISQSSGGRFSGGTMTTLAELAEPEDVASILTKVRDADGDSLAERFRTMLSTFDTSHENAVPKPGIGRELDVSESDADIRVLRGSLRNRGGQP